MNVRGFKQYLNEGVSDPNILKAVFLIGAGGSGKTFFSQIMFAGTGLKLVGSDEILIPLAKQNNIDLKKDVGTDFVQNVLRPKAKILNRNRIGLLLAGRLGMIVDGTGENYAKVEQLKTQFESLGYDTSLVIVNTPLESALKNNATRDRVIPPEVIVQDWHKVQHNMNRYRALFGASNTIEIVNDAAVSPEQIKRWVGPHLQKAANKLIGRTLRNPIGKKWVQDHQGQQTQGVTHTGPDLKRRQQIDRSLPYQTRKFVVGRGRTGIGDAERSDTLD